MADQCQQERNLPLSDRVHIVHDVVTDHHERQGQTPSPQEQFSLRNCIFIRDESSYNRTREEPEQDCTCAGKNKDCRPCQRDKLFHP